MNHERRRLNNMMNYFGWSPEDLATITGYSIHNVYTNMTRKMSAGLVEAIEKFEELTDHGKIYKDYSTVKIVEPETKGWKNLSFHLLKCKKRFQNRIGV